MQRLAFTPADITGREYAISLMRRAGLGIHIDAGGNIVARQAGSVAELPPIALGSHLDTVPNGGKYDGALGVMGAIEVMQTLADQSVTLRHPVEVLVFTNEEGTRFHRWLFGSRSMAGLLEPEDLTAVDAEGVLLGSRLADIGGNMSRIQQATRNRGDFAAYFELHIEQGPTLHQAGIPIGVVTGITGRWVYGVELTGVANHAGTTPMPGRHDALVSASQLVLGVQRMASELEICRVGTVGNLQTYSNAVNVIPGRISLGVEFRDLDMGALSAADVEFRRLAAEVAQADGVTIKVQRFESTQSEPIKPQMQELVAAAATDAGLAHQRIPSGAGHDAQAIAAITDTAMIFVPSVNGVSHAPEEFSTPEDCANGAQVLLNLLLLADERL
jgi:N-carbamoyl-L-amino-acid hydrolase